MAAYLLMKTKYYRINDHRHFTVHNIAENTSKENDTGMTTLKTGLLPVVSY